jgi:DNA-binding NarL/FixJ family response regulator
MIPVHINADDPLSRAGVVAELQGRPEVRLVAGDGEADVAVVVADEVDEETLRAMRVAQRAGGPRTVLVVTRIDDAGLLAAVEAGACGVLRRVEASADALVAAVRVAAAGEGTLPSDLLGRLLQRVGRLQRHVLAPRGLTFEGLTEREVAVLRLVADGLDTTEIAKRLCYSERTIKNVIHDVTSRLHLRNRAQAVAYAVRAGLI